MLISDVINNKDEAYDLINNELKGLGIKFRKEKRVKIYPEKCGRKKLFCTPLHLLDLTDVLLSNGSVVQIPRFVADACQRILDEVETEGIFRKAGSSIRQKEIRANLDYGLQLKKDCNIIDIASILKLFFRELPEPLLSVPVQETLIQCLSIGDENVRAILMSCLLLPPLILSTLAYFMQFLRQVSLQSHLNKMSITNLAVILTPSIMPEMNTNKFKHSSYDGHVEIIKILIEYADMIGVLPDNIFRKLSEISPTQSNTTKEKKKKKRRSGSLTRMFNGFKKIVGAIGSSENLVDSQENGGVTPCLTKSAKKRKLAEISGFSTKKKKEILDSMPTGNGGILPNTPFCLKEVKKSRLSLGGGRKNIKQSVSDKRWSIVSSNWNRKKEKYNEKPKSKGLLEQLPPVTSMPCISNFENILENDLSMKHQENAIKLSDDSDYVRVPKSEYEAIKERVAAIETRLSQEFCCVTRSLYDNSLLDNEIENNLSGPEKVLNKFEKTIEETEYIASAIPSTPSTDHLAKRLSRELKIRRSLESTVFRSPSQRKIGTIRRRSRERERVSSRVTRNKTWHLSSSVIQNAVENNNLMNDEILLQAKKSLKRGRPNTLQTGLPTPATITKENENEKDSVNDKENWVEGVLFFNKINDFEKDLSTSNNEEILLPIECPPSGKSIYIEPVTPKYVTRITVNDTKTPMLPPKSIPRRTIQPKTPTNKLSLVPKKILSTPVEETQNGRASIARLRTQNAGMVLAKAKLFDELGGNEKAANSKTPVIMENRRRSSRLIMSKSNNVKQLQLELKTNNVKNTTSNTVRKLTKKIDSPKPKSKTPRKYSTPKSNQKRQKLSNVNDPKNKILAERNLIEQFVNEGRIKTQQNKVTSFRNLGTNNNQNINSQRNNCNLNSPKNRNIQKIKKGTNNSYSSSPRRMIRSAR